jgi:S1-C subfamily serine protease
MAETVWTKLSNEVAQITAEAGKQVVAVVGRRHPSSGVVFQRDAIITVDHALRRDDDISVIIGPGETIKASVAGRDPGSDLAVLRLSQPVNAPPARWSTNQAVRVGELVLALGRTWRGNVVASAGILSGVIPSPWKTWRGGELDQFIRPDLKLYPGFSGGPLIASNGEFLGINTAGLHRSGITVPAATVVRVGKELLEKGSVQRPYLGLGMQPVALPESLRSKLNLSASEGLMVVYLEPGGPADKANVMIGDVLLEVGGQPLSDSEGMQDLLRGKSVGQELEIQAVRAGALVAIKVDLEARPAGRR